MKDDALRLHGDRFWISPYVFSCVVALEEKGLAYEYLPVALDQRAQKSADYARRSLTGRVPCLEHGGFSLAESQAIVEYLDDAFADTARAMPTNIQHRARARQIMAWIRSDLMPIREERSTTTMFYERAKSPLSAKGVEHAAKLCAVADAVISDAGAYLFGAFSVADAELAFMLHRLILNGEAVPERVKAWAEFVWKRPSVQKFVAVKRDPYVDYQY
jgi:glutathione S-transferase